MPTVGAADFPSTIYSDYEKVKARVMARVNLVSANRPWAFFCTNDESGVPKWILLKHRDAAPETNLDAICTTLRERLGPGVEDIDSFTPAAENVLDQFLTALARSERQLLSRRKQRALDEMETMLDKFCKSAAPQNDQHAVDILSQLLSTLKRPLPEYQPNWEEVAARWLDLIRPVWYQKLHDAGRHKPLLLKDIRKDIIASEQELLPKLLNEFGREFPVQRSPDARIIACIVGIA